MRLATPTPPWEENGAAAGLNHQLYVTHCLYDEGLSREAGFGVRAGSTRDPLALRFALEYPPYELPAGVEAGDEAPRRLALVRVPGGRSVLIHSAPVSPDERGRANNFFSHVVIGGGLTVCEALASWASPEWAVECPPGAGKVIPPRSGLPRGAAVHDQAVTDFLRAPGRTADPGLDDPTCPPRLTADRSRRRRLLALTLRGCLLALQAGPAAPRGRFTLLAEPGLVALLLYAAARLLPRGLVEGLTFSTYEHALTTLPSFRHARVVGTWLADPGRGLGEELYTHLGYALDTFNDRYSEELTADPDPALEEWLELAAHGEWAAIDRLHGLLGKATTIAGYKEGVQAARLARRVASGNADADDLLALKRSPLGRPVLAEHHERLWPIVRDGSMTDPRLCEEFADLIRENLSDLERRAARLLREPSGNWQPYWRVIGSALQDAPILLREALERILPEPPYPADLCLAVLAELQSQRPAEDRPRVPPHALLKTFDGENLDRFAQSPLPREWFVWAVYYALLRPGSRDDAARHVHKGDDELVRLFWQQFRLLKDAGQRRAILGALVDTVGDHGPTFLGRLITSGCVLRPDALSWLLEALGAYGREWAEIWGRDDHLGRLLDRVRTFGDEGGPIWDRFAAGIDRGVLPPGDPYQGALLLNLAAVARRPGPALPRPAAEAIADWSLLRDHFEKASAIPAQDRSAVIDACNRRRLDPIEELTTYFARFVQPQAVSPELLNDFAGFFHSFFPESCEYPDHGACLVGWLRLVADGPDPAKTEGYQRYYLQHFVPEEFRQRLAEEAHRAGKLLPAVWETLDGPREMAVEAPAPMADEMYQLTGIRLDDGEVALPTRGLWKRLPWLACGLGTGVGGALLFGLYKPPGLKGTALPAVISFLPLALALADSIALQSISLAVRLRTRPADEKTLIRSAAGELLAGALLAIVCGLTAAGAALALGASQRIGLAVGAAVAAGAVCAALVGFLLPVLVCLVPGGERLAAGPPARALTWLTALLLYFLTTRLLGV